MNRGRADAVRADLATVDRKGVVGDAAVAEASIKGRRKAMISRTEPARGGQAIARERYPNQSMTQGLTEFDQHEASHFIRKENERKDGRPRSER